MGSPSTSIASGRSGRRSGGSSRVSDAVGAHRPAPPGRLPRPASHGVVERPDAGPVVVARAARRSAHPVRQTGHPVAEHGVGRAPDPATVRCGDDGPAVAPRHHEVQVVGLPVVGGAEQHHVGDVDRPAVQPVPQVLCVQPPDAGLRAAGTGPAAVAAAELRHPAPATPRSPAAPLSWRSAAPAPPAAPRRPGPPPTPDLLRRTPVRTVRGGPTSLLLSASRGNASDLGLGQGAGRHTSPAGGGSSGGGVAEPSSSAGGGVMPTV